MLAIWHGIHDPGQAMHAVNPQHTLTSNLALTFMHVASFGKKAIQNTYAVLAKQCGELKP